MMRTLRAVCCLALVAGCARAHDPAPDAATEDAPTCTTRPVDVLIVMQATGYAAGVAIAAGFGLEELFELLRSDPRVDVHVGVVLTDMGAGEFACSPMGSDGVLRAAFPEMATACEAMPVFSQLGPTTDLETLTRTTACLVHGGDDRCWPQTFEALLKAVTPSSSTIAFRGVAGGHADGSNQGFLREDALLAVVILNAYDDCSVTDLWYFSPEAPRCPPSRVCCEDRLLPLERYVQGLRALGRDVVVSAITGIPRDERPPAGDAEALRALAARPEMQRWEPMCFDALIEQAWPSPRTVRLAAEFPGVVRSVCDHGGREGGLGPALREIGEHVATRACYGR
ncbi:MAG: hypothetical protein IT378_12305 [Sandaracinaceae bacterium]|nr:hypothetical protein [Sandaracinaceae bacterium]